VHKAKGFIMVAKRKKYKHVIIFFLLCVVRTVIFADSEMEIKPLALDHFYAETPLSSVVRTMKQLYVTMHSIKNPTMKWSDCTVARIIEIQSLSVCGALQELDRAMGNGFVVGEDQVLLIKRLWAFLQELLHDQRVASYLYEYKSVEQWECLKMANNIKS
jgi:hypothetical protein